MTRMGVQGLEFGPKDYLIDFRNGSLPDESQSAEPPVSLYLFGLANEEIKPAGIRIGFDLPVPSSPLLLEEPFAKSLIFLGWQGVDFRFDLFNACHDKALFPLLAPIKPILPGLSSQAAL